MMKDLIKMVYTLMLVCMLSGLVIASVNELTKDRIAEAERRAELEAISSSLISGGVIFDNDPIKDAVWIDKWKEEDKAPKRITLAKKEGKVVGVAFTSVGEGYAGYITVMIGIDLTGKIAGIEILEHTETPGLGANIESPELFRNQFRGKHREGSPSGKLEIVLRDKADDGWEIEALTAATVSPRGVVEAINNGLAMFDKHKEQILESKEIEEKQ